jgi:hypothetical protein
MGEANFISDNEVLFKSLSHQQIAVQQGLEAQAPSDGLLIHHKSYQYRIFKIHRSQNVTAHSLASQARVSSISNFVCSNHYHRGSCPVLDTLWNVIWENVTLMSVQVNAYRSLL